MKKLYLRKELSSYQYKIQSHTFCSNILSFLRIKTLLRNKENMEICLEFWLFSKSEYFFSKIYLILGLKCSASGCVELLEVRCSRSVCVDHLVQIFLLVFLFTVEDTVLLSHILLYFSVKTSDVSLQHQQEECIHCQL